MGSWKNLPFMDEWDKSANGPLESFSGNSQAKVQWRCKKDQRHFWIAQITARKSLGSGCPVCINQKIVPGINDLLTTDREIGLLLDEELSGFKATEISRGNNKKRGYWDCANHIGHKAFTTANQLVNKGCPVCSGRQIVSGYNDLQSSRPDLMKEWHPKKNVGLDPSKIAAGTGKKIWWRCSTDPSHEWQATGDARAGRGSGCLYCSKQRVAVGQTDLASQNPELAKLWDEKRNATRASKVYYGANKRRHWWKCVNGFDHIFQASIPLMVKSQSCKICDGKTFQSGTNDLATKNPELAKEWHPTKNGDLRPESVPQNSDQKVWWMCSKDSRHEWLSPVRPRNTRGIGCPICGNDSVLVGVNDLATTRPDLLKTWSYERNGDLLPTMVTRRSKKKVWWNCPEDPLHIWESKVYSRDDGKGCLYCTGQLVQTGVNDLATKFPEIADQWNYQRNKGKTPDQVFARSGSKYWWRCSAFFDHEWQAVVSNRTRERSNGCPICGGKTLLSGFNDLGTRSPEVAALWNHKKNKLVPSEVLAGTHSKFWWQCPNNPDHSWYAGVVYLVTGTRCPSCDGTGFDQTQVAILYFIHHPKLLAKKVGISNSGNDRSRVAAFEKEGWNVIKIVGPLDGHIVLELETKLFRWIRNDLGVPAFLGSQQMKKTAGWSETFSSEAISDKDILAKIENLLEQITG